MNELLLKKIYNNKRITTEEAYQLFSWDILELGKAADFRRRAVTSEEVGFIIDRIINYTNICEAQCKFCAFHAKAGRVEAYELSMDEICGKIEELVRAGVTQIMLQGGLHPEYTIDNYLKLIGTVKKRFPGIWLHSLSPSELVHAAKKSGVSLDEAVSELNSAGLDSAPGASDILVDEVRKIACENKITTQEWRDVMHSLAKHNMRSSATMTYGMGESDRHRIEHLSVIRDVQDETGIIQAFIPWSFSPAHTQMEHIQPAGSIEYLKIVAVARIFLDNVKYIQAGWLTEGMKIAQIALSMGANDMGGVLTEEVVVKSTGIDTSTSEREMTDIIRNAGKIPVKRDSLYRIIRRYEG
jgi:cyclic dehypoxanthinyl futalosine synthase